MFKHSLSEGYRSSVLIQCYSQLLLLREEIVATSLHSVGEKEKHESKQSSPVLGAISGYIFAISLVLSISLLTKSFEYSNLSNCLGGGSSLQRTKFSARVLSALLPFPFAALFAPALCK